MEATADPRIAFFDRHAPTWDDDADEVAQTVTRLGELRHRIGLEAGQEVLEVGCGTGRITGWLVDAVRPGRVVAVDFSQAMLTQARARALKADFRLVDICGQGSLTESFDLALCFNSFPHFRSPLTALRNMRSLLRVGGQLVILHLVGSERLNAFHSRLSHPVCHDHMPTPDLWPDILASCGLRLTLLADEANLFLLKAVPSCGVDPDNAGAMPARG